MTTIDSSILQDMLRESLAKGQNPRLTVISNSMAPLIWADDQVILEAIQPEQLHPGDIITIHDNVGLLTHRIWSVHDNLFLTRGDHALVFDEPYKREAVLGRVIGRTHKQHTLSFQRGLGQWLDKHLTALIQQENRWLTSSQEALTGVEQVNINNKTKFIHRLVFGWALVITFVVNLATRIIPGETKI